MAETQNPKTNTEPTAAKVVEETPKRLTAFMNKHPRATRIFAITGVVAVAATGAALVKNVTSNKETLAAGAENISTGLGQVASSTSTTDPTA